MASYRDNSKNDQPLGCGNDINLVGLDIFRKRLEKRFYGKADILISHTLNSSNVELIIEVQGSISFELAVTHFRIDVLGNTGENAEFLAKCLFDLQKSNPESIDIMEFSLVMTDTSIFIQKVSDFSIVKQFDNIMRILMNDFNYLVSQMTTILSIGAFTMIQ